jgi:hypothetical protein
MSTETFSPRSRRAFLSAGMGALVASLGAVVGRASPALGVGPAIEVGADLPVTETTKLTETATDNATFSVFVARSDTGTGLVGKTDSGVGVYASAATSGIGVNGTSESGLGAFGYSTFGTGILAGSASTGVALNTQGRVRFEHCVGIATIAKGTRSKTVTPGIALAPRSVVTATLNSDAGGGVVVQRVWLDAKNDRFTIFLTRKATKAARVGWHVFEGL